MRAATHSTTLAPTGAAAEDAGPPTASTLDMVRMKELEHYFSLAHNRLFMSYEGNVEDRRYCNFFLLYFSLFYPGTNSELSNASESEDVIDRDQRPRGIGGEERGSRRGGRGRGSNSGRGRGGPGSKPSNSISSGN